MNPPSLFRIFWEFFKIAGLVLGGGYAILAAAEDVFARRLKWFREGEITDALPVFQMVPGLIAGNTAIFVGRRLRGLAGSAAGLAGVALPSLVVILAVARGYEMLPMDAPRVQGAFLGLRAALAGITAALMAASWRRTMRGGIYPYAAFALGAVLAEGFGVAPAWLLCAGMVFGIVRELVRAKTGKTCGAPDGGPGSPGAGESVFRGLLFPALAAAAVCAVAPRIFALFAKYGLLCFGGGMVLVPIYVRDFVGPDAPLLQLPAHEFGNLLAVTQGTPGPVSVNAATFFGYRLAGTVGSIVATAGLLAPSFFLLTLALRSLDRWRRSPVVRGLLAGVAPMTACLMFLATLIFARMSFVLPGGFRPATAAFAVAAGVLVFRRRCGVMALVVVGAVLGAAFPSAFSFALP